MEELSFSFPEYKLLRKHRSRLEKCFDVRIVLPNARGLNQSPPVSILINIGGEPRNIQYVKNFLKREMKKHAESNNKKGNGNLAPPDNIPLIIIDDVADDISEANGTASGIVKEESEVHNTTNQTSSDEIIMSSSLINASKNEKIESSSSTAKQKVVKKFSEITNAASSSSCSSSGYESSNSPQNNQNPDDSIVILSEFIVSSTSCDETPSLSINETSSIKDIQIVGKPLPDFIPLRVRNAQIPSKRGKKRKNEAKDCVVIPAAVKERRVLRPIVIDASNVARDHGRPTNTFSCKGIKICVDYFLKRGHTDIKVLLPHFKSSITFGPVVTTDRKLLEDLEKAHMVVYTPSRKVNHKRITCHDDRFIVSLATQNNGIIVSNDQFRDIITESAEFKKTVDERLLMYCFAGDIIMIPEDPLGKGGPTLNDFLSMKV